MDELKAQGNEAFKVGKFDEAVDLFGKAIELSPENHVLYSNRSAAFASLRKFDLAKKDAEKCISLNSEWAKGYSRLGAAQFGSGDLESAKATYVRGLEIDSHNAQLKQGLQDVEKAMSNASNSGNPVAKLFSDPTLIGKLMANPTTRAFLSQPDFMTMLQAVQRDPSNLNMYLQDPRMMQVLGVAMGVNINTPDASGAAATGASGSEKVKEEVPIPEAEPDQVDPTPPPVEVDPEELAAKEQKEKAQEAKLRGNNAYKLKKFEEAISAYDEAISLDDSDISFITNRAAVHFEMGNFDECIKDSDLALDRGREIRADFKQIARALSRKGTALKKKGDLEGAISAFQKSLTEHRTADTLKKLSDSEKELKKQKEEEYLDPVKAEEEREKGNSLFKEQKFPEAIKCYTESIRRKPDDPRVWSNRAACYTKLTALPEALKDAEKAIEIDPTFIKAYTRKGHAQFFMKEYDKAMATYQQGLDKDPNNEELKSAMQRCVETLNRFSRGDASPEELAARQQQAMQDPEVQTILSDPIMRQVLNDFQENPQAAQKHMQNKDIMKNIQKLVNAGIIQVR